MRRPIGLALPEDPRTRFRPISLRFRDRRLERGFVAENYLHSVTNVRLAHALAIVLWIVWGVILIPFFRDDLGADIFFRYGIFIPIMLAGFVLTFTPFYRRIWLAAIVVEFLAISLVWMEYVERVNDLPADLGYVGLTLIIAFTYTILRLRFMAVAALSAIVIAIYLVEAPGLWRLEHTKIVLGTVYLVSFALLGVIAAYRMERFTRLLFIRDRELERSRARSEGLLRNVLPRAIVDRLAAREEEAGERRLAESLDDVTVLFADAVGFTEQAEKTSPDALVEALDELFRRFDALADRFGLEKIKTVGDEYMAVAGAPDPAEDHAAAGAEMGLAILEEVAGVRWPSGDPIHVRVGIASGPAMAGVIGRRKFAYDLWGATVNLASRLESNGQPGRLLVSEATAQRLDGRYEFGPRQIVDVKGKGPTPAHFLLGRRAEAPPRPDAAARIDMTPA